MGSERTLSSSILRAAEGAEEEERGEGGKEGGREEERREGGGRRGKEEIVKRE
jgi:hypothetical protein